MKLLLLAAAPAGILGVMGSLAMAKRFTIGPSMDGYSYLITSIICVMLLSCAFYMIKVIGQVEAKREGDDNEL